MITRRTVLLAGAIGLLVAPRLILGQPQSKASRIGVLWFGSVDTPATVRNRAVFRERLAAAGYVDGKNVVIEERSAEGSEDRLRALARVLVSRKVDVIVAPGVTAARAARQATSTIPIVMVHAADPVGAGLISTLARPGGNVTGTTNLSFADKQIELMRELVPRVANIVALVNPSNAGARRYVMDAMEAGHRLGLRIAVAEVARAEDFQNAFAMIREMRPDGLLVMADPFIGDQLAQLLALVNSVRLPATYDQANMARSGGMVAYGPVLVEHYVMAASYVDRILKGAKPADLPVEQPKRFELVINLKSARALGLTIPPSLIARADEVIR